MSQQHAGSSSSSNVVSDEHRVEKQRAPFKPEASTLELIGSIASKVAALDQRNRGFVLAELKKIYFGHEITMLKKAKGTSTRKGQAKKSEVNQKVADSAEGKALAEIRLEIKDFRAKQNPEDRKTDLPLELHNKLAAAVEAVKNLKALLSVRDTSAEDHPMGELTDVDETMESNTTLGGVKHSRAKRSRTTT